MLWAQSITKDYIRARNKCQSISYLVHKKSNEIAKFIKIHKISHHNSCKRPWALYPAHWVGQRRVKNLQMIPMLTKYTLEEPLGYFGQCECQKKGETLGTDSAGRESWWWWWLFPCMQEFWGKVTIQSPPALFFLMEISSCTQIPLFRSESVHSGSASWDDCGWVFPDKLHMSLFPDRFPYYAWTTA